MTPKTITIIGRRWFHRGAGKTYHSAKVLVDGEVKIEISETYGYGDQYLHNGFEALERAGIIPMRPRGKGDSAPAPWAWCQEHGITLSSSATDVAREEDL